MWNQLLLASYGNQRLVTPGSIQAFTTVFGLLRHLDLWIKQLLLGSFPNVQTAIAGLLSLNGITLCNTH